MPDVVTNMSDIVTDVVTNVSDVATDISEAHDRQRK
jgi:hypothetical protein